MEEKSGEQSNPEEETTALFGSRMSEEQRVGTNDILGAKTMQAPLQWWTIENHQSPVYIVNWHFSRQDYVP